MSRYTARFTGRFVGQFYNEGGSPRFTCFSVKRNVGKDGADPDLAMFFLGALDLSPDRTAMQIIPITLRYPKLKAKALWTDKTAAVAITLDFRSAWKDKNNVFHNEQTASVSLYNHKVPIGEEKIQRAEEVGWLRSDWLTPVIPSVDKGVKSGNFSLTVTVVETTETGADIVGVMADTLRQNKADIVNVIVNPAKQN